MTCTAVRLMGAKQNKTKNNMYVNDHQDVIMSTKVEIQVLEVNGLAGHRKSRDNAARYVHGEEFLGVNHFGGKTVGIPKQRSCTIRYRTKTEMRAKDPNAKESYW